MSDKITINQCAELRDIELSSDTIAAIGNNTVTAEECVQLTPAETHYSLDECAEIHSLELSDEQISEMGADVSLSLQECTDLETKVEASAQEPVDPNAIQLNGSGGLNVGVGFDVGGDEISQVLTGKGQLSFQLGEKSGLNINYKLNDPFSNGGGLQTDFIGSTQITSKGLYLDGGIGLAVDQSTTDAFKACEAAQASLDSDLAAQACTSDVSETQIDGKIRIPLGLSYYAGNDRTFPSLPTLSASVTYIGNSSGSEFDFGARSYRLADDGLVVYGGGNYSLTPGSGAPEDDEFKKTSQVYSPEIGAIFNVSGIKDSEVDAHYGTLLALAASYEYATDNDPLDEGDGNADGHSFSLQGLVGINLPFPGTPSKTVGDIASGMSLPLVLGATYSYGNSKYYQPGMLLLNAEDPSNDDSWVDMKDCSADGGMIDSIPYDVYVDEGQNYPAFYCGSRFMNPKSSKLDLDATLSVPFSMLGGADALEHMSLSFNMGSTIPVDSLGDVKVEETLRGKATIRVDF